MTQTINQERNKRALLIGAALVAAVLLATFLRTSPTSPEKAMPETVTKNQQTLSPEKQISAAELLKKISSPDSGVVIFDLREAVDFQKEHILDAKNISGAQLPDLLPSLARDKQYVLLGAIEFYPEEKQALADLFRQKELGNFYFLTGGFAAWKAAYQPTISAGDPTSFTDQSKVTYIKTDQLQKMLAENNRQTVIDVRPSEQFKTGHLKGAINIFLDDLESSRATVPSGQRIVVYGTTGLDAFQGAVRLFDMGVLNVVTLSEGFATWQQKGLEVEK